MRDIDLAVVNRNKQSTPIPKSMLEVFFYLKIKILVRGRPWRGFDVDGNIHLPQGQRSGCRKNN